MTLRFRGVRFASAASLECTLCMLFCRPAHRSPDGFRLRWSCWVFYVETRLRAGGGAARSSHYVPRRDEPARGLRDAWVVLGFCGDTHLRAGGCVARPSHYVPQRDKPATRLRGTWLVRNVFEKMPLTRGEVSASFIQSRAAARETRWRLLFVLVVRGLRGKRVCRREVPRASLIEPRADKPPGGYGSGRGRGASPSLARWRIETENGCGALQLLICF